MTKSPLLWRPSSFLAPSATAHDILMASIRTLGELFWAIHTLYTVLTIRCKEGKMG